MKITSGKTIAKPGVVWWQLGMMSGHWHPSRTSVVTGRHKSGCTGLPGCRWCSWLLHQSQASSLTLLAQGFFHAHELLHQIKRMKKGQNMQWAASGTHCCTVCQQCWEEGTSCCAVWHGSCCSRKALSPLCQEVSTKNRSTRSVPDLYVMHFGFKPLQTLCLQAQESHIHLHLSSPHCTRRPQSLLAPAVPPSLLSAATSSKPSTSQSVLVPSASIHLASSWRFWHLRTE